MATTKVDDVTQLAKDALHVTVGLGVIAFQKAQVQRNQLQKQLKGPVGDARTQIDSLTKALDDRVKLVEERMQGVEGRIETVLDQLEERLPEQARDVAKHARAVAKDARSQVRDLVARAS
ncbi:MAG: hypothetical protein ABIV94_05520 [Acidimicrobiales bacterium]